MKTHQVTKSMAFIAGLLFAGFASTSEAEIVQNLQVGGTQSAFDGSIAVNLVRAGQGSLSSVTATASGLAGSCFVAGLNDGSAAGLANMDFYGVLNTYGGQMPAVATFQLSAAYDINMVQAISGWSDSGFGEHKFQLLLSINNGAFTDFGTYTNNGGTSASGYMTTLTSSSGLIASNVTGIQFIFMNPDTSNGIGNVGSSQGTSPGQGAGGTLIRELQVFGTLSANVAVPTTISITDTNVLSGLTPNNWVCKTNFIGSAVDGASVTVGFNGTTQVFLKVDNSNLSSLVAPRWPIIAWSINGGALQTHQLAVTDNASLLLSSGVTNPVIDLFIKGMSPFEDRYSGDVPPNSVKITGFVVDQDGTTTPVALPSKVWLNIGDSIMSGDAAAYAAGQGRPSDDTWAASDDARASYGYLLAKQYGYRESRLAFGGYDWAGGLANVPALATLIDQMTSTVSRLTNGFLNPIPDVVLINLGENGAPALTDVTQTLVKLRSRANPDTKIIVMIPASGKARTELTQAFNNYTNSAGNQNTFLVDLGQLTYATGDGIHPTSAGHLAIFSSALPVFNAIIGATNSPSLPPFMITPTQPAVANGFVGKQIVFSAVMGGSQPMTYQWQKINAGVTNNIDGATNVTMTLTNLQLTDTASYCLQASNAFGVAVSTPGSLTVFNNPATSVIPTTQMGASFDAFDGSISVNLIQAGQSSLGSVVASHDTWSSGFPTTGLNDGSAAAYANLAFYYGNLPVTLTFNLNTNSATGGSPAGYTINSIQALTGWHDSYFANQTFELLLSLNGGIFTSYGAFTNSSTLNGGDNSILVTLTGSAGPVASGVTGVQFVFQNPNGAQGTLIRELQAFGSPMPVDLTLQTTGKSSLALTWYQGTLLEATNINGPWTTNAAATSPFSINPTEQQKYFRVLVQ